MDTHFMISRETARQQAYQSLAGCFQVPDNNIARIMDQLSDSLETLSSRAGEPVTKMRTNEAVLTDTHLLKAEFSRLFIGPYTLPAPPYGSVYIEKMRKTMGESTIDALKRYQAVGVDLADNFREVPDHVSAELEFMFLLIYKEIEGIRSDDPEMVHQMLVHQISFLQDHLNSWIPEFAGLVMEHASEPFYCLLADTAKIFMAEDHAYIEAVLASAGLDKENRLAANLDVEG
ncbi:MAG: molecular chaperone TorD family protein [Desulfotignum sp.]|nr:molecular chaperone TorD family protein [Desulfotignum sp.]